MLVLFWTMVVLLFYVYVGYTLLVLLISLFRHVRVKRDDAYEPNVTLLVTAYNEELDIARKLEDSLELDYPAAKLEIMVASDGSTDATDAIVNEYASRHDNLRLVRVEGRVGKTETQNQAVARARGDVIVFSDATTEYEANAIRRIVRNYADPSVGAVSGRYHYKTTKSSTTGLATILFWTYENFIKSRQTRIKTITGCCGCIYSVRKDLYAPLPATIISDLVEPLKIVEKGYRIVFEPEAIAYETTTEKVREEFKMRVRVITRGMNGLLYMKALFNPFRHPFVALQLGSHKVLRWCVPIFMLGLLLASIFLAGSGWLYATALAAQLVFYALAVLGLLADRLGQRIRIFDLPLYFCVVNGASLVSLFNVLRRENKTVWETVRN